MTEHAQLFERVYDTLHALANRRFRERFHGNGTPTLQPTALVHEVYVRLARSGMAGFRDREHLLAVAATAMRQILIDHARRRNADKRAGGWTRVTLGDDLATESADAVDVVVLNDLVERLAKLNARHARIVELRVFAGLTIAEVASALGVSLSTAEKEWRRARAWLRLELERSA